MLVECYYLGAYYMYVGMYVCMYIVCTILTYFISKDIVTIQDKGMEISKVGIKLFACICTIRITGNINNSVVI